MAVGGRKGIHGAIEQGCDFLYDYTCSPCNADRKNKEAIKFCIDCGEYMCGNCLSDHNRFAKMKSHQVVDPAKYDSKQASAKASSAPLITIGCEKHHGKVLDMFCGNHNLVCCAACIALGHSGCKNKFYIPDIASGVENSEEYKQHEKDTKNTLLQLEATKQKRKTDLALSKMKKEAIYSSFKQVRDAVIARFDELENHTVDLVEHRFRQNAAELAEDLKNIDKTHEVLKSSNEKLKNEKGDSQKFVLLKTVGSDLDDAKRVLKSVVSRNSLSVDFKLSNEVTECFTGLSGLGAFYEAVPSKIFSVQDKGEKQRCSITGICQLEDGSLVLADVANQNIKRLRPNYTLIEICSLQSQPWSVCTFGTKEIAVSLCNEKAIQFVTITNKMQMSRSFKVKDACAGIASCNETLFVGFFNRKQIQIYDHSGYPLKTIDLTCGDTGYVPWCIAITENQKFLYVAAHKDGVVSVDLEGQTCRALHVSGLKFATSVALADDGKLLITCKESNTVIRHTDGLLETVLSKADGIESPQALCYHQQDLVVASVNSDAIRVY